MKWGLYVGNPGHHGPVVTCEAETYDEAVVQLWSADNGLPEGPRHILQIASEGECVVGRHYPKTGPILSEEEL